MKEKEYRVILLLANYRTKAVWVMADSKIAAGAIAKKDFEKENNAHCRVWAVYSFAD